MICRDRRLDAELEWQEKENFKDEYVSGSRLGSGSFGTVFVIKHIATGKLSALKMIRDKAQLQNDVTRLRTLSRYPDCNPYVSCYYEHFTVRYAPDKPLAFAIRMEYLSGGNLRAFKKRIGVGEQSLHLPAMLKNTLLGLQYIHSHDIIHADIKPDNLVFRTANDPASIVLVDFGLACHTACETNRGTWLYQGPEVFTATGMPGKATDIFSLAASFYTLYGRPLWVDTKAVTISREEHEQARWELEMFTNAAEHPYGAVLLRMFEWRRSSRPTATEALARLEGNN